jgi:hypothetical protein
MPTTWATAADVLTYAAVSVDAAAVLRAQATIDMYAVRLPEDADRIGSRDQYWLKLAVAYQAAWQASQPDIFDRLDVTATGGKQAAQQGTPTWMTLAPHASQALRCVSWMGSGSFHVRAPSETGGIPREVYGDDGPDPGHWQPI